MFFKGIGSVNPVKKLVISKSISRNVVKISQLKSYISHWKMLHLILKGGKIRVY